MMLRKNEKLINIFECKMEKIGNVKDKKNVNS